MKEKTYKSLLWWGMAALLIFTPLARGAVRVWSITPVLIIAYMLIFVWLWRINNLNSWTVLLKRQEIAMAGTVPVNTAIFAFAGLAVVSCGFSIYKHDSFYALLRLFAYIGLYYFLTNNFKRQEFRRLFGLVVIIGAGLSLYGILQYFGVLNHSWWVPKNFLAATYVNHNHFAGYLELAIPIAAGFLMGEKSQGARYKWGIIAALGIMAVAFILTQSRGAWISLVIALLAMSLALIKRKRIKKSALIIFILLVAVIFSVANLTDQRVAKRIETVSGLISDADKLDTSFPVRLKIWQGAWGMIKERPLVGVGIGDFDWGFYRYRPQGLGVRAVYAHNDYLQMAAEMGVLAPLLMLLIFGAGIISGIKRGGSVTLGCAAGVLSLALHGCVDFNFHIPANMLLFTVCFAYVMRREHA